ncbi:MAG: thioredoxin domain-containing protein [Pyrinomonadaceae bacterium]|nr:thioredoxin domain-containing protein [Pyrinomonadaceae bacterium]
MEQEQRRANKLIDETSPYLLQHAHNPVEWYPWGDEAFERARAEDKPVIVSIGYSACHWCHVMEHESFEDERVAEIMNRHFINVKVDMEERPDVDQIYMNFVQLTTGRGGWPMNVFVTPEKLPFFGGTYFPPSPRYGMISWPQLLESIAEAWRERRDELMGSAYEVLGSLRRMSVVELSTGGIDETLTENAFGRFVRTFDPREGGWGGAPKFPAAMSMEFLLRYWKRTGNDNALTMVKHTAEKMARGGIYDQLGGGFHRYSVDAVWLVPHFEKMLYDNAQLIRIYLHLYQITKEEFFRTIAVETLEYVRREMTGPEGGFYSTQDADSEGEEGKFFVWSPEEIAEILGEDAGKKFCAIYDVTDHGNFEGHNILNRNGSAVEKIESVGVDQETLDAWRSQLFEAREKRIKPNRDEKVLTAWNGLMLAAFAEAAAVLGNEEYLATARANAEFLLRELVVSNDEGTGKLGSLPSSQASSRVLRTWKDGRAKLNGYIEDYANFADGLIELFQVSGEERYLEEARRLADAMITEFWDEENGGFFFTSNDHEELIVRNKDLYDNATPSGNSVAADVLLKLAKLLGDERYERFGLTVLRLGAGMMRQHPSGFGRALATAEFYLGHVKEVVIAGPKGNGLERELWSEYRPFKVAAIAGDGESNLDLLKGRTPVDGKAAAYVCEGFVCKRPVTEPDELRELLDEKN